MADTHAAVVIGGTSGIGRAIALRFAEDGFRLAVSGRDRTRGGAAAACEAAGAPAARFSQTDIGDAALVEALARAVEEAFGVPHVVVNCAGMPQSGKRVLDQDLAEDAGLWRVNYRRTLPQTISLLELRLSVVVEAAGLCAGRPDGRRRRRHPRVDGAGRCPTRRPCHRANPLRLRFPPGHRQSNTQRVHPRLPGLFAPSDRAAFSTGPLVAPELEDAYYARIHGEHEKIVDAIEKRGGRAARQSMRRHLCNSLERVRALALASGAGTMDAEQTTAASSLFADLRPVAVDG